jgi:thiosulfate/3-mercaptopyruvate sulfurtransferase
MKICYRRGATNMRKAAKLAGIILALGMVVAAPVGATPAACGGHGDKNTMLVSTAWLAEHLKDPNVVVLAVGDKSEYDKGHIPGSFYVDYMETHLMTGPTGLSVELPPMSDLENLFGKFGVTNDSRVVLYPLKGYFSWVTRIYLTLDAMGLGPQSAILDGGLPAWSGEGRDVSTAVPVAKRGTIKACQQSDVIASLDEVESSVKKPGVDIIDARATEFYSGQTQPGEQRRGHIPGAGNLPFNTVLDDKGKLKSPDALAELFRAAGMKPGDRVIAYCHIGQQATAVYFAGRYLGYNVKLFDGSWEEWSKHTELPADTSH